jgi:hypothetical protein
MLAEQRGPMTRGIVLLSLLLAGCPPKQPITGDMSGPAPSPGHPDMTCPASTEAVGLAPPHGLETYCARIDIRGDSEKHGPYLRWHDAATLAIQGNHYVNKPHGAWQEFYANGRPKLAGHYTEGDPDGPWAEYYDNGEMSKQGTMTSGRESGHWQYWAESGVLEREGTYNDGEMDDIWMYYRLDGEPRTRRNYRFGRLISQTEL